MHRHWRRILGRAWRMCCIVMLALLLLVGYGTPAADHARCQTFMAACPTWQKNPDFRRVQDEYIRTGSAAMRSRLALVPATRIIMTLRSIPGLPASLAANEGSQQHYEDFAAGELSSYFRLSREQGTDWVIPALESLAREGDLPDERLRRFLEQFRTEESLATDAGAIASLRRLIEDTHPAEGFRIRDRVADRLRLASIALAQQMGLSRELGRLTPPQQHAVYIHLDEDIRRQDPELWRAKQVNDFLNGIWAQTFGQTYARWMSPLVDAWYPARIVGAAWVLWWVAIAVRRRMHAARHGS